MSCTRAVMVSANNQIKYRVKFYYYSSLTRTVPTVLCCGNTLLFLFASIPEHDLDERSCNCYILELYRIHRH